MKETDLYRPMKRWLEKYGYEVHPEVTGPYRGASHDIVAVRRDKRLPIIIELKVSFTITLAHQCASARYATPLVFAAAPSYPSDRFLRCWAHTSGFGVIKIDDPIRVLVKPRITHRGYNRMASKRLREIAFARGVGDWLEVGGRPTRKGTGPAHEVARRVRRFLFSHPNATWDDIFEGVPNHYAHAHSMAGALRERIALDRALNELSQQK